jgi:RNA polymerase sigma-70 factor (ECF subfamily)
MRLKAETGDVVQQAMVSFLKYGPRFLLSNATHFRALIVRIVENVLRDQNDFFRAGRRNSARERALPDDSVLDLDLPVETVTRPMDAALRNESVALVRLSLELMKPEDREIILLRQFEGMSFAEIGKRLSIAEDSARMRFQRALPRLAEVVERVRNGRIGELLGED